MTRTLAKISLFLGLTILCVSCNAVKHLEEGELLLTKNTINVDGEEIKDSRTFSLLSQRENTKTLGVPVGLHIYNLADPTPDSTHQRWLKKKPKREERLTRFLSKKQVDELGNSYIGFNQWLQKSGDAPVIIDENRTKKSIARLKDYYNKKGWFNVDAKASTITDENKDKRAELQFDITRYQPYIVDSISEKISSPIVDSLFQLTKGSTFVKSGKQYDLQDFLNERDRLTIQFRNSGLFHFDQDYVRFEGDTVDTEHKINVEYQISDRKVNGHDTVYTEPFKVHTINEVRVVTDYTYENRNKVFTDSISTNGYKLYSYDKLKFKPKAITDAMAISANTIFRDIDRTLTYNQISNLRIFKYPNISYAEDPRDTTGTGLIATVLLSPRKKMALDVDFDAYTSTIQQFGVGFSTTFLIRNVFRGAETLEISARGSVGSSKDAADSESSFFNISEFGGDVKLGFPRILFPINTDKIIPKYMSPSTSISSGFSAQNNIGLDRQTINTVFNYRWKPSQVRSDQLDLFNVQYVRNLKTFNYFNVYTSTYDRLNEIARSSGFMFLDTTSENPELQLPATADDFNEANFFILDALNGNPDLTITDEEVQEVQSIGERQFRLTEDNLIFATNYQWTRDTRDNILDKSFSRLRWKIETAGNLLSTVASLANLNKDENGNNEVLGVVFSQYAKLEADYIKHWEINENNIFAIRAFGGIAIPYGNSKSIPFTRSYFGGGANDNRGWRAYDLGPGSSGGIFDFNEANFKLAFNAEYRYTILGSFKGAFFVDAGNIWNVLDDVENEAFRFSGLSDLKELAVASGLGLRYDFGIFVLRLDVGFKTHNPGRPEGERWFKDFNFANAVYNIGINYPF